MTKPIGSKFISHNNKKGEVVSNNKRGFGMKFEDSSIIMDYNDNYVKKWIKITKKKKKE